jgi:RimJ/RimL family protein N-acetyltransferase
VLAYAEREADAAVDSHIGDEHLWLGLLREEQQSKTVIVGLSKHPGIRNIRARARHLPREIRQKYGRAHALRTPALRGKTIRLEPLSHEHIEALVAASGLDPSLYKWSPVPQGKDEATKYVKTALAWQDEGTSVPFAIVRLRSNGEAETVVGSTRFWNIERWDWPHGHSRHMRSQPDACEIGYTWLTQSAIRTATNTEAKLLMLTHAFETWQVLRVCFHTDARNQRSRAALERIGGKFEGILRAHRMAADFIPRDSARFSIVEAEWPEVKGRLSQPETLKKYGHI